MATILILVLPLPSHINGHALLAANLQARGHTVVFGAMEDALNRLQAFGLTCIPFFSSRLPAGKMSNWLSGEMNRGGWRGKLDYLLQERQKFIDHENFVEDLIAGGYQEFLDAVKRLNPALILVDNGLHTYWALMAAMAGVPAAYTSLLLPIAEDAVVPPLGSLLYPASDFRSKFQVALAWRSHFAARWLRTSLMRLAGIPDPIANFRRMARVTGYPLRKLNVRTLLFPVLDLPTVILCPREFDFPEAQAHRAAFYAESLVNLDRPEPEFPWDQLNAAKKLVYCSLGSVAYNRFFFQNVLDAVSQEPDWQLVLNIGTAFSAADFERLPPGAILVNGAPQLGLLRRAAAMINHGGINSVRECILFGVPQVVFPIFFDQFGSAARVQFHELGVVGDFAKASIDGVHRLLSQVLNDPGFLSRSKKMSAVFQTREKEQPSVAFVESLLG
jgi:zeaxanthin glucosyltransferase